jgi:hypothetical protein
MKTKGINSLKELDAYKAKTKQEKAEIIMKSMMCSCFAYSSIAEDSYSYDKYILPYLNELPVKVFDEVYKEQSEYLKNCTIIHNVYTDSEGCTYNEIIEPVK